MRAPPAALRGLKPSLLAGNDVGEAATVSSTYLWRALRDAGITLEGTTVEELEDVDVRLGAEVGPFGIEDGLYFYTAEERAAGLEVLWSKTHNQIYYGAGWLGNLLTDAADDAANQLTNCFAHDFCGDRSRTWRLVGQCPDACDVVCTSPPSGLTSCSAQPLGTPVPDNGSIVATLPTGSGRTVSPENFLFWDPPHYGHSEVLEFRSRKRQIHRWQPASGTGNAVVTVSDAGGTVAGATVVVAGTEFTTDANGTVTIPLLAGTYNFVGRCGRVNTPGNSSQVGCDGNAAEFREGESGNVEIDAGVDLPVPIIISGAEEFRRVIVSGTFEVIDDESDGSSDERERIWVHGECFVDPASKVMFLPIIRLCAGHEVRGTVIIRCELLEDNTVDVKVTSEMFEGNGCQTNDQEHEATRETTTTTLPGQLKGVRHHGKNKGAFGVTDEQKLWLWIRNVQAGVGDEPCLPPGEGEECAADVTLCKPYVIPPPQDQLLCQ